MALYFYPGLEIPLSALASGATWSHTWSNGFVQHLTPPPDADPSAPLDPRRPINVQGAGGNPVVFNILGEGRSVDFFIQAGPGGCQVRLHKQIPGTDAYAGQVHDRWSNETAAGASDVSVAPDNPSYVKPTCAIRHMLEAGAAYFLEIGWAGNPGDDQSEDFYIEVSYTPALTNDLRVNALPVIIGTGAGAAYNSPPILNAGFTQTFDGTDDPVPAGGTFPHYWSAWWRYEPQSSGQVTAFYAVIPQGTGGFGLTSFEEQPGTPLVLLSKTGDNATSIVFSAVAGRTYWLSVGYVGEPRFFSSGQKYQLTVSGPQSVEQGTGGPENPHEPIRTLAPDPTPPIWNPPEAPDPYNPGAELPDLESGSATLLELVRTFSSKVRRAVRITGPQSIAMVDPNVPLPAGWSNADAPTLYTSASRSGAAETTVLSIRAGDVTLTASASLLADDVRVLYSTWRLPDRLPLYGLKSTAVQRVTYTFTPDHFQATMDFHYPAVPLEARES